MSRCVKLFRLKTSRQVLDNFLHAIAKLCDHQASISHSCAREQFNEIGWFVQPTIFSGVNNDMRIAREEISNRSCRSFRTVMTKMRSRSQTTPITGCRPSSSHPTPPGHGLWRIGFEAGRVILNGAPHEPLAPFGGFKQSGFGREFGVFGREAFLEPRAVLG
ncbi:aldehyde dehydrogenase family protein [Rhizobium herbae]